MDNRKLESAGLLVLGATIIVALLLSPRGDLTGMASHEDYPSFSSDEGRASIAQSTLTVQDTAIHKVAWYSAGGGVWQPLSLQGDPYAGSEQWLNGTATSGLPAALAGLGEHYIIIYSCTLAGSSWDCHGVEGQPDGYWQLLVINNSGVLVTASSDDGNVPGNTRDGNLSTRWSALGIGEWIQYELPSSRELNYLTIAFHSGDSRLSYFNITLSEDGSAWSTVYSGQSSGTSLQPEPFPFESTTARFIRVVGLGNSQTPYNYEWNSYTEVDWGLAACGAADGVCPAADTCTLGTDADCPECKLDSQCDDADPSTVDSCSQGSCVHDAIPPACGDVDGYCPSETSCVESLDADCPECKLDNQCDDADPSTIDSCQGGACQYVTSSCDSFAHFDGVCGPDCEGVDIDCHQSVAELHLPVPSAEDYANKVYIDPTYDGSNGASTGSITRPYTSWTQVTDQANTAYLQKRGTTDSINQLFNKAFNSDGVLLGAYGDPSLPRPVIDQVYPLVRDVAANGLAGCGSKFFWFTGDHSTIRDLDLRTSGSSGMVHIIGTQFFTAYNVSVAGHDQLNRISDAPFDVASGAKGTRILHSSVNYSGDDGIWMHNSDYTEIGYTSVENVNMRYYDSNAYDATCWNVEKNFINNSLDPYDSYWIRDQTYAGGDALQGLVDKHTHVHHSYIIKDTPNKFVYLDEQAYSTSIFEHNYLYHTLGAGGLHPGNTDLFIARYNVIDMELQEPYQPGNVAGYSAIWSTIAHLEAYGNIFLNQREGMGPGGTVLAYNNVFYNISTIQFGTGLEEQPKKGYVMNNIFYFRPGGNWYDYGSLLVDHNLYTTSTGVRGTNVTVADPLFVSEDERTYEFCAGPDMKRCAMIPDFRLRAGSPAIDAGLAEPYDSGASLPVPAGSLEHAPLRYPAGEPFYDFYGNLVPAAGVDIGAQQR